jgi:hypothetical protein
VLDIVDSIDDRQPAATSDRLESTAPAVGDFRARLALAETCPKWSRCGAAYCPALGSLFGGKHYKDERVCAYLLESVKGGGQIRLRGIVPTPLADVVISDSVRLRDSAGPLQKPLNRASQRGSRIEAMKQASQFKARGVDRATLGVPRDPSSPAEHGDLCS